MKKGNLKGFITGIAVAIIIGSFCFPSLAATVQKVLYVDYGGISIMMDGVKLEPKDSNDNPVEPFIYNGTTYLPVRAMCNAINKEVSWDGNTKTVYVGDNELLDKKIFLMALLEEDIDTFLQGGVTAYGGIWQLPIQEMGMGKDEVLNNLASDADLFISSGSGMLANMIPLSLFHSAYESYETSNANFGSDFQNYITKWENLLS